jgi:hypothetical protein
VHSLAVELRTVWSWGCATRWHRASIAPPIVKIMINVSVEALRPMKIWTCTDKYPASEPFRAVVTIWGAIVRRYLVISIRTDRGTPDTDGYVVGASGYEERGGGNQKKTEASLCAHSSTPTEKIMQNAHTFHTPIE